MGMNLKDVIDVSKAGYTPAEVKELFALSKDNDEAIALAKEGYKPNEIKEFVELANASDVDDNTPPTDAGDNTPPDDVDDNTPPTDEKDAKIAELEKKLQEMQQKNVNQSVDSHNKTDEDIINDALAGLLN